MQECKGYFLRKRTRCVPPVSIAQSAKCRMKSAECRVMDYFRLKRKSTII